MDHPEFWKSPGKLHVLGGACVYLHGAIPSCSPEKSQATPALCTPELWSRERGMLDTLASTPIYTFKEKGREKKILSLPKRHSRQGRWAVHFSPLSAFSFIRSGSYSIEESSWVFGSSFKSFNHWLPQAGFHKHGCVLSIFVCSTTVGNRPAHGVSRGEGRKLTP